MRTSSPRQLAILIAVISSVITAGAAFVVFALHEPSVFISLLFIALAVFIVVFIVVFYSMNNFIFEKLKPIYKTIHSLKYSEDVLRRELDEKDIIEDVQNDVMIWARQKTKEITQLRRLEKYRREFLGDVSHELKTPIFNIQGYVLTLLDGGLEDENINRRYLERTEKSVNRLISIVNDLESISRLESGELKLEFSRFDIIRLIEEIFEDHEIMSKERKIKLMFKRSKEKSLYVEADRKQIQEAISNLIGNSIKYGKKGGTTTVGFDDMEDHVLVEISDNGIGIAEKDLPRIFERFFRTDRSRSREMGGTGLGLAIVKHIIEAHNQTINVRSELDTGTSFSFPLRKA